MKIAVVGTGYVGLVTGVCLSEIGHHITCIDINEEKVALMSKGQSPIYEPGLDQLMKKNIQDGRLTFTSDYQKGLEGVDAVYLAVGTPQMEDGSANLDYIFEAAKSVANHLTNPAILITKSTVPIGTNDRLQELVNSEVKEDLKVEIVSNPEFLREGSAIYDTFHADRIVIGSSSEESASIVEEIYKPFGIPVIKTDIRSAEMIKYASNTFLATKISFMNEISNICEQLGANVDDVAHGMGTDVRIGNQFLQAGIGYGGSCFPKDTHALVKIAENTGYEFNILKSVITVNNQQQLKLTRLLKRKMKSLKGKKIAILGLSFKPNTDDMRESPAIPVTKYLSKEGAEIIAYDPIAMKNAKKVLPSTIKYEASIDDCLRDADAALILTNWDEITDVSTLEKAATLMKEPIVFDGRNCFELDEVKNYGLDYYSIGRPTVKKSSKKMLQTI